MESDEPGVEHGTGSPGGTGLQAAPAVWWALGLLLGAAALLRFFRLGQKPFWLGEMQEIVAARSPRFLAQIVDSGTDAVGFFWHHAVWLAGMAPEEWITRVPSALLGTLTVAVVWMLGRRLGGTVGAFAAAIWVAVSFFHVMHSQDARSMSYLVFFYSLSWLCMLVWFEDDGAHVGWAAAYVLSAGLAGLSHAIGGVYLVLQAAYFGARVVAASQRPGGRPWRAGLVRYLAPAAGAAVLASLQLLVVADYGFAFGRTRSPVVSEAGLEDLFLLRLALVHLAGAVLPVRWVVTGLALVGMVDARRPGLLAVWTAGPAALLYALCTAGGTARFEMYHLLPSLVPFALAVGIGLERAAAGLAKLPRLRLAGRREGAAVIAAALALAIWGNASPLVRYFERPTRPFMGADMRSAARHLEAMGLTGGDTLLFNYAETLIPASFYAGREMKKAAAVTPWRPPDPDWQYHLLVRAAFQATDSDIERLSPDEIVTLSELPPVEQQRTGRMLCLLFWPEGGPENKGYAAYYRWLTGHDLYVFDRAVDQAALPAGWTLERFFGVDLLIRTEGPYTISGAAAEVLPLLLSNAPPLLRDMAPAVYGSHPHESHR
ncbi:MAG: hypothetical protein FJ109_14940 [Deltaproteobacteria bacterium]|nr:hypothetical protein [Deltaproteobacteria bacterium]